MPPNSRPARSATTCLEGLKVMASQERRQRSLRLPADGRRTVRQDRVALPNTLDATPDVVNHVVPAERRRWGTGGD